MKRPAKRGRAEYIDDSREYCHTLSDVFNGLIGAGFSIEGVYEDPRHFKAAEGAEPEPLVKEADRLGFKEIFISKYNTKGLKKDRFQIRIHTISKMEELYRALFE